MPPEQWSKNDRKAHMQEVTRRRMENKENASLQPPPSPKPTAPLVWVRPATRSRKNKDLETLKTKLVDAEARIVLDGQIAAGLTKDVAALQRDLARSKLDLASARRNLQKNGLKTARMKEMVPGT